MTSHAATQVPCPRCDRNPVKSDRDLCMQCRAEEIAECADDNPQDRAPLPAGVGAPSSSAQQQLPAARASAAAPKASSSPAPAPAAAAPAEQRSAPPPGASQQIDRPAPARTSAPAVRSGGGIGISKGRVEAPMRIVIYGIDGVGKTRFGADAPKPIFIPAEVGAEGFDVARFDEPHAPRSFEEVIDCVRWLQREPHDYKTAVLDTADAIEAFAFQLAVRKHNKRNTKDGPADNIEEVGGGYKKGYSAAAEEWRRLLSELEILREKRGMHVIMCAHARISKFANPQGDDYDRYSLKLHPDCGLGLVKDWPDAVLFATFKTVAKRKSKRGPAKGEGGRERVLLTTFNAAYDAKNRYELPDSIPLDWATFQRLVEVNQSPGLIRSAIDRALEQLEGEVVEVKGKSYPIAEIVAAELATKPDLKKLAVFKNRLEARVERLEEERAEREEAGEEAAAAGATG